jgi:hypothetical protein
MENTRARFMRIFDSIIICKLSIGSHFGHTLIRSQFSVIPHWTLPWSAMFWWLIWAHFAVACVSRGFICMSFYVTILFWENLFSLCYLSCHLSYPVKTSWGNSFIMPNVVWTTREINFVTSLSIIFINLFNDVICKIVNETRKPIK